MHWSLPWHRHSTGRERHALPLRQVFVLPFENLNRMAETSPLVLCKLFAHIAAAQCRRLTALHENDGSLGIVVDAASDQPADMRTLVANPALFLIFHRWRPVRSHPHTRLGTAAPGAAFAVVS